MNNINLNAVCFIILVVSACYLLFGSVGAGISLAFFAFIQVLP